MTTANELALILAEAQTCFAGHNLLSTATEADLRETARRFLDWWNLRAGPALVAHDEAQATQRAALYCARRELAQFYTPGESEALGLLDAVLGLQPGAST